MCNPLLLSKLTAARLAMGMSFADTTRTCEDAIKDALMSDRRSIGNGDLMAAIPERNPHAVWQLRSHSQLVSARAYRF
jgi:hypothetical protein